MSNITEKNTDRQLTDYLPPALVKDWRQFMRARGYLALFILLQLVGWYFIIQTSSLPTIHPDDIESLRLQLFYYGVIVLCVIVPFRAGSSVSSDTKVRGSNFLMLTPLSARRIVWGTWCSTALQVLLAALLALPMLGVCRHMEAGATGLPLDSTGLGRDMAVLGLLTLCGWVTASLFMFTAGLARFFRIALLVGVAVAFTSVFGVAQVALHFSEQESLLEQICEPPTLAMLLGNGIAVFVLMLELTRRHYAAPAENCSISVRILSVLPLLGYLGMALFDHQCSSGEEPLELLGAQATFAVPYMLFALLSDALLPTYSMPVHTRRAWRGLPAVLQVPGLVPSAICILAGCVLAALPSFISGEDPELSILWSEEDRWEQIAMQGLHYLNLAYTLLLWLLVTDLICRRDNQNRPVVCGFVALISFGLAQSVADSLVVDMLLPLAGASESWMRAVEDWQAEGLAAVPELTSAYVAGGMALCVVLGLLVGWRGRVQKG